MTDLTSEVLRHLSGALRGRTPTTVSEVAAQRAAVAVILTDESEPALLLVRRRERDGDPWSGHVALPGGFRAAGDESPEATAERETEEETGLSLRKEGHRLGLLDDESPRSVLLPRIVVTPVVFAVRSRVPVSPGPEVASAAWLPLTEVLSPSRRRPFELEHPTGRRVFEAIEVGGFTIWGLTERILSQIHSLLRPSSSPP